MADNHAPFRLGKQAARRYRFDANRRRRDRFDVLSTPPTSGVVNCEWRRAPRAHSIAVLLCLRVEDP